RDGPSGGPFRSTSPTGWARERLRDRQPRRGLLPFRPKLGVEHVRTLGHHEAELMRVTGDPLGRLLRPEGPRTAVGCGEFDAELLVRHRQSVRCEGEIAGAHAEPGHVPQPRGRTASYP